MPGMEPVAVEIPRADAPPLPGLWLAPAAPQATIVLGHGAGSGMRSPFMTGIADGLAELGVATLRFDFPYMAAGRKAPDRPPALLDASRAAFAAAAERADCAPLAGGKSLGGRIASMAVAEGMPAAGLVFLGYPLHPPGRPDRLRDAHLDAIRVPMLFLQGTRDAFATPQLLHPVLRRLGERATLHAIPDADHGFRLPGERRDAATIAAALAPAVAEFAVVATRG
jgi:predicted alpha/beta-hydrolase family hydrolase